MISMDVNHPDIFEFVKIKRDLTKVTGANVSVKLNNEFMKAVEKDEDYILRFPVNLEKEMPEILEKEDYSEAEYNKLYLAKINNRTIGYTKKIKAKELWNEIIKSAHGYAEPGLLYWDRMIDYSPDGVYSQYRAITTNPCSEIGMQPYDACRLIAVNLFAYVINPFTEDAYFDYKQFYENNYEAMRLSDDLIDLELEHIQTILDKIETDPEPDIIKMTERKLWREIYKTASESRRTGLGFTGLADTLAALNIKYGSERSLEVIEEIMKTKMKSELDCTIDLAILRGTFHGWDNRKEFVGEDGEGGNDFYQFLLEEFPEQSLRMNAYGRRNISFSTVAPTGSVSILAQVSSGIEPLFMPFYMRRKKVNANDKTAVVTFVDDNGDAWEEFPVIHEKFKDWIKIQNPNVDVDKLSEDELNALFDKSPWANATANDIDWKMRVKTQALIQKYISHSISSTVNLPSTVTEEEVSGIYLEAWKEGVKGITVYRDGSRSGVLVSQNSTKDETKFEYTDAYKRPVELEGDAMTIQVAGKKISVFVGLIDDKPYEVFMMNGSTKNRKGKIVKEDKGKYIFISEGHRNKIISNVTPEQEFIGRLTAGALRHGMHPKYIVKIAEKAGIGILDFTGALKKALAKYLTNEDVSDKTCPSCGSKSLVYEEGCKVCKSCGWSACG